MECSTIRGRTSKDTRRGNTGKKIAGPEEMLVDEVPQRVRSTEAEQRMKHWNLFTNQYSDKLKHNRHP